MIQMTANEMKLIAQELRRDKAHDYAADPDRDHDRYGCDTHDVHRFDARHTEDVFPY